MDRTNCLKLLNYVKSKDVTRPFIMDCYAKGSSIYACDGNALLVVKYQVEQEGYCLVDEKGLNIVPLGRPGDFPNIERVLKPSEVAYKTISVHIPECFKYYKNRKAYAFIDINKNIVFGEPENALIKLDFKYFYLFAGSSVNIAIEDKENKVYISSEDNPLDYENNLWTMVLMPLRYQKSVNHG
jgi:hypothetical protein